MLGDSCGPHAVVCFWGRMTCRWYAKGQQMNDIKLRHLDVREHMWSARAWAARLCTLRRLCSDSEGSLFSVFFRLSNLPQGVFPKHSSPVCWLHAFHRHGIHTGNLTLKITLKPQHHLGHITPFVQFSADCTCSSPVATNCRPKFRWLWLDAKELIFLKHNTTA